MLTSPSNQQQLPPLLSELLHYFIQRPQKVISRETLIDVLWKDKYINENALSRAIAELRKALGDSPQQPQYIKTLPKKGYQFIHTVINAEEIKQQVKQKRYRNASIITVMLMFIYTSIHYLNNTNVASDISQALNQAQRITAQQGMEQYPQISRNGSTIVYLRYNNDTSEILIYDIQQQKVIKTIFKNDTLLESPVFSHSGNQLIMTADKSDVLNDCNILLYDLITEHEQVISSCTVMNDSSHLAWGPDDESIFYTDTEHEFGTVALWQLDLTTYNKKQITFPTSVNFFDNTPRLSPDARYLSFSRGNQQIRNIYLKKLNSNSGKATSVTNNRHYTVSHDWLDDENIILDSDQTGERLLWLLNIRTSELQLLGARGAQYPSVDDSGSKMAFQIAHYEANIWSIDLKTGKAQRLIHSTKYDNNPTFSPNGQKFVFTSNRQNHGTIWQYDMDTHEEKKVFELPQTKLTRPSWSPNGKKLLVTANNQQGLWSYEYDLITNQHKKLNFKHENFAAIYVNDDIYALTKPINGESSLLKLTVTNQAKRLNVNGISRFMATEGNKLIFSKSNKDGLYVLNLNDLSEHVLYQDFSSSSFNHWSVSGQTVYYKAQEITESDINYSTWKININTGKRTKVSDAFAYSVGPSMSINYDHSIMLLTKTDRAESDVFVTQLKN